jgi:hypothetical protein
MIERGSGPNKVRLGVAGEATLEKPFFTIHVNHLGKIREETVWCTALNIDQIGTMLPNEIDNVENGCLYCVHIGCSDSYAFSLSTDGRDAICTEYFIYNDGVIEKFDESRYKSERKSMASRNLSPLYAEDGHEAGSKAFEIVFFFAGVNIHFPSAMEGVSIFPISPGLSNESTFEAVRQYLLDSHTISIPFGGDLNDQLIYQPMFSVNFHKIVALTEQSAFAFATRFVQDISTIIASERGDKPFPVLSLILHHENGNWRIDSTKYDFRGNLLPPMFSSANMRRVEYVYPIIKSNPYARLIVELFVQSISERDRSFRFFRQWAILELIADRRITASSTPLLNLDQTQIKLGSGKTLTTERKEGKVYSYLRSGSLTAIYQGTHSGVTRVLEGSAGGVDQGGGVVTLWEAVAASYNIRNEVAHDGRFDISKTPRNARDKLSKEIYSGVFGFMDRATEYAVWKEIAQIASLSP